MKRVKCCHFDSKTTLPSSPPQRAASPRANRHWRVVLPPLKRQGERHDSTPTPPPHPCGPEPGGHWGAGGQCPLRKTQIPAPRLLHAPNLAGTRSLVCASLQRALTRCPASTPSSQPPGIPPSPRVCLPPPSTPAPQSRTPGCSGWEGGGGCPSAGGWGSGTGIARGGGQPGSRSARSPPAPHAS